MVYKVYLYQRGYGMIRVEEVEHFGFIEDIEKKFMPEYDGVTICNQDNHILAIRGYCGI